MYAAMWSEHCSYKSSKVHLRTLPTEGPAVLVGPGAGRGRGRRRRRHRGRVQDRVALAPLARSSRTRGPRPGVGGIVRDIISMGARPIALLDPLRFGPLAEERNRWLFEGVVAGIGGYGNCIGVPTVGGEVQFADAALGEPDRERDVRRRRPRRPARHVAIARCTRARCWSCSARRPVATASAGCRVLASSTLEEGAEERRPSVQIGDPFAGKLLIEASLELVERDLLEGLQDLGGAGITCAVSESASRAGLGAELDLDAVPLREPDLEAFEILTSESQERMLAIVAPGAARRGPGRLRAVGARDRGDRPARPRGRSPRDVRRRRRSPTSRPGRSRTRGPSTRGRWRPPPRSTTRSTTTRRSRR